jgi:hypothetical protein
VVLASDGAVFLLVAANGGGHQRWVSSGASSMKVLVQVVNLGKRQLGMVAMGLELCFHDGGKLSRGA